MGNSMSISTGRLRAALAGAATAVACFAAPMSALAQSAANATADTLASGVNNLPSTSSYGGELMKVVGVMCLILAMLFAALWLLKRFGRRAGLGVFGASTLKVEGQIALGPKKQVFVVRFLNKRLVLGVTESSINLLTETDADDDDTPKDFSHSLDKARDTSASS